MLSLWRLYCGARMLRLDNPMQAHYTNPGTFDQEKEEEITTLRTAAHVYPSLT